MVKRRLGIITLLFCFFLCSMPCTTLAASTTNAKEPISIDKECNLTVYYGYDGTPFSGQTVKLYKIAEVTEDFQYALTPYFAASNLILNGVQTNSEWNVIRSTLDVYILANNIAPTQTVTTNEAGNACFESLTPGLYLASAVQVIHGDLRCSFDSALVALPGLNTDGYWQYQIAVAAKPEILPPVEPDDEIELKVLKLWKGDENRTDRPQSIEVEIFRNGTSYETVTLSESNHWSYTWSVKDDGADWKVIERNIPKGYAMTVERRVSSFVLTNTRISENPEDPTPPPKTGDTSNILLYIVLMYVSGTMLVLLGITGKRKQHEETN